MPRLRLHLSQLAVALALALAAATILPAHAQDPDPPAADGDGDGGEPQQKSHEVREGETLESISRLYYGTTARVPLIMRVNRLVDPTQIYPGMVLIIPPLVDTEGLEGWATSIRDREPLTLPGDATTRTCLRATATHVYYLRVWWPAGTDGIGEPDGGNDGEGETDDESARNLQQVVPPPPPVAERRAICRVSTDPARAATEEILLDVGRYDHHYFLTPDGDRIVALRQVDETDADARDLVIGPADGSGWRVVWRGGRDAILSAIAPRFQRAMVLVEGTDPFQSRILSVSLNGTADDADDGNGRDRVLPLTEGIYVECVTPDQLFAVVARLGEPEDPNRFNFNRGRAANITGGTGPDFAIGRPPVHVLVPLEPGSTEQESVLVPGGEEWGRVVLIEDNRAWLETLRVAPPYMENPGHPVWQSRNILNYVDRQNLTVVPVTSDEQYDDQLVGRLPGRGMLYLHNTNINRHLTVFAGGDAHVDVHELSPLTLDFALAAESQMLWFLEYATESSPFDPLHTPTRIRGLSLSDE